MTIYIYILSNYYAFFKRHCKRRSIVLKSPTYFITVNRNDDVNMLVPCRIEVVRKCKEQTSKYYTQRKSPPFIASMSRNVKKRGNDGVLYESVSNKDGTRWRWKKVAFNYKSLDNMSEGQIRKCVSII